MKYIIKRKKNYYFKIRIPKVLNSYFKISSYFVKSLETVNAVNAEKNAKILLNKINYIKQSIKMNVDKNKILALVEDLTNTIFTETEHDLYNVDKVEDTVFALTLEDKLTSYKNAYSEQNYTIVENEAISILKSLGIKYNENDFNTICKQLLENHIQNLKIIFNKIENKEYYEPNIAEKLGFNVIKKEQVIIEEEVVVEEDLNSVTLEEAYIIFIENAEIGDAMLKSYPKYFSFLIKLLGENRDISTIKKTDFINFKNKLNKEKHYNELLEVSTKKRYVQFTNKFFKHFYGNDLIKISVQIEQYKEKLKDKIVKKKENYSIEELGKWYKWALNIDDLNLKWITLLAIFNGFGTSEMTRLEKHNVIKVEGVWCVQVAFTEIKKTKNLNRIRIIPLNLNLIKLGFLEYVDSLNNGFIFTINNKQFSRKMTDINRKFVTTNPKRTFHRIRANFINTLVQSGERAEYVAAVVGQSQEFKITLEDYSDKINVKILSKTLKKINYKF